MKNRKQRDDSQKMAEHPRALSKAYVTTCAAAINIANGWRGFSPAVHMASDGACAITPDLNRLTALECLVVQHIGLHRENQEDAASVEYHQVRMQGRSQEFHLAVVTDGCGGMAGGEEASTRGCYEIANSVRNHLIRSVAEQDGSFRANTIFKALLCSFAAANNAIVQRAAEAPELHGMASTGVCAVVHDNQVYVAWAGDSRLSLYRNGCAIQETSDHNRAQLLVDAGIITAEEAAAHPGKSHLTNALGTHDDDEPIPEVALWRIQPGDLLVVSSDGFHEGVTAALMTEMCARYLTPSVSQEALRAFARILETESLAEYGHDNLTAVFMYVRRTESIQ